MVDAEKRKRVMARSMQLGHCICDPKKDCPCDVFRQEDLCPCAGERPVAPAGPVRLTSLVQSPGCASKIDEATLKRVLEGLPFADDPRVLVGAPAGDDAGVYRLDGDWALVQTVDVFAPSVDDPFTFGRIAAANSLSDVYAMGGRPITALSIVGFPARMLPEQIMHQILRGGMATMAEAGVAVIGGHSIDDSQIKAGFAVTGLVRPERIVANAGARPGDRLILTKPLGTGIVAFAAQIGRAPPGAIEAAARSMAALNRQASERMLECGVHACTDVTGFGMIGHLGALARASRVDVEIVWDDVPLLPGVLECAADGILPGAVERNRESSGHCVVAGKDVSAAMLDICFDAQTSGGLLIAVPEASAGPLVERLHEEGIGEAAVIGRVCEAGSGRVRVVTDGRRPLPTPTSSPKASRAAAGRAAGQPCCSTQEVRAMSCCEDQGQPSGTDADLAGGIAEIQQKFHEFLKAANAPRALDARTKQAVAVALSVLAKCEPCLKIHIKKARDMGFSQDQIDEAAWMAIAFGGSPARMFYNAVKKG